MEQPDTEFYSLSALELFPTYTRETYLAKFGIQAPPFDPSKLVKKWFDVPASTSGLTSYTVFQNGAFSTVNLDFATAAYVNLPGKYAYAKYTPTTVAKDSVGQPINPRALISESDVNTLVKELQEAYRSSYVISAKQQDDMGEVWGTETRRRYNINVGNYQTFDAAALLCEKYSSGVNAPGKWLVSGLSDPVWIPTIQDTGEKATVEIPVPVRTLLANEELLVSAVGTFQVHRTDMGTSSSSTSTVDYTEQLKSLESKLDQALNNIGKLMTRLGVS